MLSIKFHLVKICVLYKLVARGGGVGGGGGGYGGMDGDGQTLDLTRRTHRTCTDDVLYNCAPETCVILLTSVTPKNQ